MKLSDNTLTILKNFASINNSILVKQGTRLRTISVAKNILAEANIIEDIDVVAPRYRTVEDYTDSRGLPYDRKQAYKVNSIDTKVKK